jgi:hypothetical protein
MKKTTATQIANAAERSAELDMLGNFLDHYRQRLGYNYEDPAFPQALRWRFETFSTHVQQATRSARGLARTLDDYVRDLSPTEEDDQ